MTILTSQSDTAPPRHGRAESPPRPDIAPPLLGWHYLSNATRLMRPRLFYASVRRVKDHRNLLHDSQLLKNNCIRQVVLDKWFPLNHSPCLKNKCVRQVVLDKWFPLTYATAHTLHTTSQEQQIRKAAAVLCVCKSQVEEASNRQVVLHKRSPLKYVRGRRHGGGCEACNVCCMLLCERWNHNPQQFASSPVVCRRWNNPPPTILRPASECTWGRGHGGGCKAPENVISHHIIKHIVFYHTISYHVNLYYIILYYVYIGGWGTAAVARLQRAPATAAATAAAIQAALGGQNNY